MRSIKKRRRKEEKEEEIRRTVLELPAYFLGGALPTATSHFPILSSSGMSSGKKMTGKAVLALLFIGLMVFDNASAYYLETKDDITRDGRWDELVDRIDRHREYIRRNEERRREANDEFENWHGRWMPERPGDPTPPPKVFPKNTEQYPDYEPLFVRGIPMGQPSDKCDNGKTNLTVDWDGSPVNYTCYGKKIIPNKETIPVKYCEQIPKGYTAMHKCMYDKIEYDDDIPLYGTHRPLWPVYGEYKFVPKQRWLHSLEHGAIVMLYHPCANPLEVKRLKSLVFGCLQRHIISPYNRLPEDRPLALLAWGCRLTMSYVNPTIVMRFIREHALRGPEQVWRNGVFDDGLLVPAKVVSDQLDSTLCPNIETF